MSTEGALRQFGRLICDVADGKTMSKEEACDAYRQVILNEQPELQQGAFLMAHITRGPTTVELSGAWTALDLYDTAKITATIAGPICDIVGTGSDKLKTVNCSTPASLIAAACGLPVAKKGARLVTGVSGASDIFEIFGVDLNGSLENAEACLNEHLICYLPGESFLKSGWARLIRSMRFTSAFNIIGPLTRPCAQNDCIVIGAYSPQVCDQLVAIVKEIGMLAALAPYGWDDRREKALGMDEFSTCGPTRVVELKNGAIEVYELTPADLGVQRVDFEAIASRTNAKANADAILKVLSKEYESPLADFFCVNAGAALYAAGRAKTYREATDQAKQALAAGKALEKLEALVSVQGAK